MRNHPLLSSVLLAAALAAPAFAQPAPTAQPAAAPAAPAPATPPAPAEPAVTIRAPDASVSTAQLGRDTSGRDVLDVDMPDQDIRVILQNVADLFDLNISVPESLQGKTSIKLRSVTWQQIFGLVLQPVGYTYVEEGNIVKIVTVDSLQQEPPTTDFFPLSYAKAADVMPTIQGMLDPAAGGKIVVDARTNSLLITARASAIEKIRPVITELDRPTDQVMIETMFVEVTDDNTHTLGIDYSALKNYKVGATPTGSSSRTRGQDISNGNNGSSANGTDNTTTTTGNQSLSSGTTTAVSGGGSTSTANSASTISNAVSTTLTDTASTALNLLNSIANTGSSAQSVSAVFSADQFGVVLSALNELGRTKVISKPTIVTLNNSPATINVGESDPVPNYSYNEQRGSFEVSGFIYKDIGINLTVTPQVNARGFIKLSVQPEVSQKNGSVNFGGAGGAEIPIVATRKASTNVSLADGFTLGLGGLLTSQSTDASNNVPFFGDIPLIGNLFKHKSNDITSTDLLIFITAKSISADGAPVGQIFDPSQVRDVGLKKSDLPGTRDGSDPFLPETPPGAKK